MLLSSNIFHTNFVILLKLQTVIKSHLLNDLDLKFNHFDILGMLFPFLAFVKVAPYSFLTARELVLKSRDGARFKKSTRKSRATSTTASNSHWSNFSNHRCSFPMC